VQIILDGEGDAEQGLTLRTLPVELLGLRQQALRR
jgi:hypothetical protein